MTQRLRVRWEDGTSSPGALELCALVPEPVLACAWAAFDGVAARDVPLCGLRSTLAALDPRKMRALLDRDTLTGCRPVLVVEYGAARYVVDGNHRATAHALLGDQAVPALVARLDPV